MPIRASVLKCFKMFFRIQKIYMQKISSCIFSSSVFSSDVQKEKCLEFFFVMLK